MSGAPEQPVELDEHDASELLRAVIDGTTDAVFVKDRRGRYLLLNEAGAALVGKPIAEILGRDDTALFAPESAALVIERDRAVLEAGTAQTAEERLTAAGVERIYLATKAPFRSERGEVMGLVGISRDITERIRHEEQIRALNAELEARVAERTAELTEAYRELEAFSCSVSHDLRAPLRAIDGFAREALEQGAPMPEAVRERLGVVRASAQRMGRLLDDLLSFSRLSRSPVRRAVVSHDELVRSCLADLAPDARVRIELAALPPSQGDVSLLRQVWLNLLSNALKYSSKRSDPRIEVRAERRDERDVYSVRDNGVGFDMRYADKLFHVFSRLHTEAEFDGTGVGLAIAERIVRRHGGAIWAEAAPGQGACFFFTLGPGERSSPGASGSEKARP